MSDALHDTNTPDKGHTAGEPSALKSSVARSLAQGIAILVLLAAGGVAANLYLRQRLEDVAGRHGARLVAPPVKLCTDNGAMIAWAGIERLRLGMVDALDFKPRPRWPLDVRAA